MTVSRRCHACSGSGKVVNLTLGPVPCTTCSGTGTYQPKRGKSRKIITLRITTAEDITIKCLAERANLSINEWLRRVALGDLPNGYEAKHVETKQAEPDQVKSRPGKSQEVSEYGNPDPYAD